MEQSLISEHANTMPEFILKPVTIKDVLLLAPGRWNDCDYTELEINKAFNNTNWSDRKYQSLYLDHQDTKERGVGNWVGYIKNQRLQNSSLYGDLEIWNPMIGAYLSQAKARFGISATLAGTENRQLSRMEDFHFESFSIVTDPACKPAMINLSDTKNLVNTDVKVVTMDSETKENLVELGDTAAKGSTWITYKDDTGRKKHIYYDKQDKPHHGVDAIETFKIENPETVKKNSEEKEELLLAGRKMAKEDEEIAKGTKKEIEHKDTYDKLLNYFNEKKGLPTLEEFAKMIATDHVENEDANYYEKLDKAELGEKFERQVQHIKDSLKKEHPDWDETKIKSVAYATANKLNPTSENTVKENSDLHEVKGGNKIPEMENESIKVAELETKTELAAPEKEAKKEDVKETEKESKKSDKKEDKEDKEELSNEAILNKIKEMSAEELTTYTNFVKAYLSDHKEASAKEVTLAYMKSAAEKSKELSATDLLASIDSRISSLKELDSTKKVEVLETQVKELSAKVKTPDRKTLSVAFESNAPMNSNLGMLSFLQHRI